MRLLSILGVLLSFNFAQATTYYVSPTGNDAANSGTSSATPWATVAKVNATTFVAGDSILFEGGKTWTDTVLTPKGSGTSASRITFDTYGTGKATIALTSTTAKGLFINGNDFLTFRNLIFKGPFTIAQTTTAETPYGVHLGPGSLNVAIDRCEVTGFYGFGILIGNGSNNLSVTHTDIHDNGHDGVASTKNFSRGSRQLVTSNVYIGNCKVYNNKGFNSKDGSGSGIVLRQIDGAVIEYCESYNNGFGWGGNGGGPVGIWSWDCNNVLIQYCESHHNKNGAGGYDGGGIDIDGGDTNCVVQYCYTHDNDGCGQFVAHFSGSHPTDNNTIRYNISYNDGIATGQGAFNLWGPSTNGKFYNNVIIGGPNTATAIFRNESPSAGAGQKVWNNIFVSTNGKPLVSGVGNAEYTFQGNLYFSTNGIYNINGHTSLAAWQAAGQEKLNGNPVGIQGDPRFVSMTNPGTVTVANLVSGLAGYRLPTSSPAVDAGLDLAALFTINPGSRDYFGNLIPNGLAYDIGAHDVARGIYSISGTITLNGGGLAGVNVSAGDSIATTAADGTFSITGLVEGSYTLTPTKASYSFSPVSQSATITSSSVAGKNFNATLQAPIITPGQSVTAYLNGEFSYQIQASGSPTSYALVSGALPAGITLNTTTGLLSGNTTATGTFTPSFTATNSAGTSSPGSVSLRVISAKLIISEPFAYPVGTNDPDPDAGLNGGNGLPATNEGGSPAGTSTGLRATWGTTTDVVAGLSYVQGTKTLATSGGAGLVNNATWGGIAYVYKSMSVDPFIDQRVSSNLTGNLGADGTSLYVSLLAQTNTSTDNAFRFSFKYDGVANFYVSNTTTGWSLNGTNAAGVPLALNTPTLLVLRFDFTAGTATVSLWVNPTLGASLGTANAVAYGVTFPGFVSVQTNSAVASAMTMDEIRFGATYASVTPYTDSSPSAPVAPSALSAMPNSSSQITLNWTDNATNETGFKLERSADGSTGWMQIAAPLANAISFSDIGLAPDTLYFYRIRAANSAGDSAWSVGASATTWNGIQGFRAANGLNADGTQDGLTPAGDGVANILKYAFNMIGSGPSQAASLSAPNSATLSPGGSAGLPAVIVADSDPDAGKLQFTYVRRRASTSPGITYGVEFSDALATWEVNGSASERVITIDGSFERVTVSDSTAVPTKRFARVRINTP